MLVYIIIQSLFIKKIHDVSAEDILPLPRSGVGSTRVQRMIRTWVAEEECHPTLRTHSHLLHRWFPVYPRVPLREYHCLAVIKVVVQIDDEGVMCLLTNCCQQGRRGEEERVYLGLLLKPPSKWGANRCCGSYLRNLNCSFMAFSSCLTLHVFPACCREEGTWDWTRFHKWYNTGWLACSDVRLIYIYLFIDYVFIISLFISFYIFIYMFIYPFIDFLLLWQQP